MHLQDLEFRVVAENTRFVPGLIAFLPGCWSYPTDLISIINQRAARPGKRQEGWTSLATFNFEAQKYKNIQVG